MQCAQEQRSSLTTVTLLTADTAPELVLNVTHRQMSQQQCKLFKFDLKIPHPVLT